MTTSWFLANNVYQELYGIHLHPLSSHRTVWPLLFVVVSAAGLVEGLLRLGVDRGLGRGGLGPLV